jgi:hypothetical protein
MESELLFHIEEALYVRPSALPFQVHSHILTPSSAPLLSFSFETGKMRAKTVSLRTENSSETGAPYLLLRSPCLIPSLSRHGSIGYENSSCLKETPRRRITVTSSMKQTHLRNKVVVRREVLLRPSHPFLHSMQGYLKTT